MVQNQQVRAFTLCTPLGPNIPGGCLRFYLASLFSQLVVHAVPVTAIVGSCYDFVDKFAPRYSPTRFSNDYHDAANQHHFLKTPLQNGKFLVIFKETSGFFPICDQISGRDCTEISDTPPAPAPVVAPVAAPAPDLTQIISSLNTIAKRGSDRKDLEDMRKMTLNVAGLPVDVKLIYEKRQAQAQITKSDIKKKFQNILTIKPGDITNTQKELNFIRWPARKLNFLIYKDSTIFWNLQEHIKDQRQNFCKSLMPIKKWDAKGFYKLYCNIKEQCLQHCLWVLPYCCHSKTCSKVLGFVCADEFVNNDSDLPYEFRNHTSSWSTTIYKALNYEKVLPEDAKTMLANFDGCGYTFLCQGCVMFNPNLVENPTKLSPSHPRQGKLSYDEYVQAVCFHYTMQGLAANHRFPLDDENIQDTFFLISIIVGKFNRSSITIVHCLGTA